MSVKEKIDKIKNLESSLNAMLSSSEGTDVIFNVKKIELEINELRKDALSNLTAWDKVLLARDTNRPTTLEYIAMIFDDFIELHGDRYFGDDASIVGGIASIGGINVTVIGHQKGRTTEDNIKRNFGMPNPEGYRKAQRLMKQAEKFSRPIITFVDTPGAFPGVGAEERGQASAIASILMEMSMLKVPIYAIVTGEGGSGGALALSFANKVAMLENSTYSILSPEGFATILWKDSKRAAEAAEIMKLTADDLYELGVIEEIIKEPLGGAGEHKRVTANEIKKSIEKFLQDNKNMHGRYARQLRYGKFRKLGSFQRFNYREL